MNPSAPAAQRPTLIALAVIVLAGIGAYWNSFAGEFVFDDIEAIVDNPTIREVGSLGQVLSPPFDAGQTVGGRPFLNFTLAVNYAIGGTDPWSYHAVNLVVHVLAGLVLFGLVRRTFDQGIGTFGTYTTYKSQLPDAAGSAARPRFWGVESTILAVIVALLWMLHPLQTESVTYVVQRAESLMGLLYLFTLYAFMRAARDEGHREEWYLASWGACLLGMATKEVMVSAPLIVLLYDAVFVAGGGLGGIGAALRRRRGYYAGLAATWLLLGYLIVSTRNRGGSMGYGIEVTLGQYLLTQGPAIAHYLRLVFWPSPLIFDYGAEWVTNPRSVLPAALLVVGLGVATVVAWRRAPWAAFLGTWFFAILAPTSLVPANRQTITEHRMYLALVPVMVLLVLGARRLLRGRDARGWGLLAGSAVAAVACAVATVRRNEVYRSDLGLWTDTVEKRPNNAHAHNNLGRALVKRGDTAGARQRFEEAVRLGPDLPDARSNLGTALLAAGDVPGALAQYEAAVDAKPDVGAARFNLGTLLVRVGRVAEGIEELEEAVRLQPGHERAWYNLANALRESGRAADSVPAYRQALRLRPGFADAQINLAATLGELGRGAEAIDELRAALQGARDNSEIRNVLGILLARENRIKEARDEFARSLEIDPNQPGVRANLERAEAMLLQK